jgi:nicotinamide mononucleotide transporter
MNVLGIEIPQWFWDYSGSVAVIVSLVYLFKKRGAYWHWSNASLIPLFILFALQGAWLFAGLQVSYLIFGVHGLYLWFLEGRRDRDRIRFNEPAWYAVTWIASIAIFTYTVFVTDFSDRWNLVQFTSVLLSLIANFATTRKWTWSWPVWIISNLVNIAWFWHTQTWGQFGLQFVLIAMSAYGWVEWARDDKQTRGVVSPEVSARGA